MSKKSGFLKPILVLCSMPIILFGILLIPAVHNNIAKMLIMEYAKKANLELSVSSITLSTEKIIVKDFLIQQNHNKLELALIEIEYDLFSLISRRKSNFLIYSSNLSLNDKVDFELKANGKYNNRTGAFFLKPELKSTRVGENSGDIESINFNGSINYLKNMLNFEDILIQTDEGDVKLSSSIKFSLSSVDEIKVKGEVSNLSLMLYKILLHHQNSIYKHFDESIPSGTIKNGNFEISLLSNLLKEFEKRDYRYLSKAINKSNIYGEFHLENIEYIYEKTLPSVKSNHAKLFVEGKDLIIDLSSAVIAENIIKHGQVKFDYMAEEPELIIQVNAEGDAKSLLKFAPNEALQKLRSSDIDLEKVRGKSITEALINIPLKVGTENVFNIKSKIEKTNLNIFNDKLQFTDYSLEGHFDGKKVKIKGRGLVNKFKSSSDVNLDLDSSNGDYQINSKIILAKQDNEDLGVIFKEGEAILMVSLTEQNGKTILSIDSDLSKVHFYLPALAMNKLKGRQAKFALTGEMGAKKCFSFKVSGQDSLNVAGSIELDGNKSKVILEEVKYNNNNFKGELTSSDKLVFANIYGSTVDLSEFDFSKMFKGKKQDISSYKINLKLDKIKLKNGINFTETLMDAECSNGSCPVAHFYSSIDSKDYISLNHYNKKPKSFWELETNDAGKLLEALGISNKIKKGILLARIDSPLTNASVKGYKAEGLIELAKFKTSKSKFLAKIVSFISIPGLLGALSNHDIYFDKSIVAFTLENDLVTLNKTITEGPYFNFYVKGSIDLYGQKIKLRGQVAPSLYGLNDLLGSMPFVKILYGYRKGIVLTPFYYEDKY